MGHLGVECRNFFPLLNISLTIIRKPQAAEIRIPSEGERLSPAYGRKKRRTLSIFRHLIRLNIAWPKREKREAVQMLSFTIHDLGDIAVFECNGRLTVECADALRNAVQGQPQVKEIVLDLKAISEKVTAAVRASARIVAAGGASWLCCTNRRAACSAAPMSFD